jgi:tetratricopeptide (TPR) repeat protein
LRRLTPWIARGIALAAVLASSGCPSGAAQSDPELSRTHYLLGADYLKKKLPNAAKRELLQAVELDPENDQAHKLLGVVFFMEGVHKVNLLERTQCLHGTAAEEQRQAANKEFRRAEGHLKRAVALAKKEKRTDSEGLNYLANVALHFKRYDQAIALANEALENILYGARHLSLATLGWAYYNAGKLDDAARELRQAVFHEPRFCLGRYRLARVYYAQEEYDKAIAELTRIADAKSCPIQEAHQLLGLALMKTKKRDEARDHFDSCVSMNPNSCVSEECRRYAKLL